MKKKSFAIIVILFLFVILGLLIGLKIKNDKILSIKDYAVIHETKFGGVYVKMTIEDFDNLGFKYGDSVNVEFSNGYKLLDIPYYNGYYVDIDEPLLVGYPGYDYIKVAVNYGDDLWITAGLNKDDKATITLNESGKYIKIQNARNIKYTDTQGDIPNVVFANFRNVKVGNIKENILYRSASPSDNSHNRAPVVDKLIQEVGINYIVNLSDSDEDLVKHIKKDDFNSPYFLTLYNNKKVVALSMDMIFKKDDFKEKLVLGLTSMANNEGPYLVHCVEGKDRTGYVIMILESLMNASYEEMVDDYMLTYKNYYDITEESDKEKYDVIKEKNIDLFLHYIIKDTDNKKDLSKIDDYSKYTKDYLLTIGMKEEDINKLIEELSE